MRVVIFGCGYVGRALAEVLAGKGHEVWIQSRNRASLAAVEAVPEQRRIVCDLHARDWHGRLSGHWDLALNLVSSAGGGIEGYRVSYLEGNRSIREWAKAATVDRFIYTSATSVYPQTDGEWVDEEDVPEDLSELSASGAVLRASEREVLESDVFPQRVIARLAGIYGPGRHLYLDRLREGAGALPGEGSHWLNLIHRDDIVAALLTIGQAPLELEATVFNVVDNAPSRKQAIVDWLAGQLGIPTVSFDPNLAAGRSSRRVTPAGLPNRRVRNTRVKAATGWEPDYPDFRAGYSAILKGG